MPDVIVLSKAIGGSLPLSVVIYDQDLDQWNPGAHIGTFRGNQMAMAAGTATLKFIKNQSAGSCRPVRQSHAGLFKRHSKNVPAIGDVRGRGLMIGAEIVNQMKSRMWMEVIQQILS